MFTSLSTDRCAKEINQRGAPGESADSGFLGRNQTIQQCLLEDWKTYDCFLTDLHSICA
jgi:hypothetical protein